MIETLRRLVGGDLKTWAVLTEASTVASGLVLPYVAWLYRDAIAQNRAKRAEEGRSPPNLVKLAGLSVAQSQVMFGVVTGLGLNAAHRMGMGAPRLKAQLDGEGLQLTPGDVARYAGIGAGTGLLAGLLHFTVFGKARGVFEEIGEPGLWQVLLAVPYGGIGEEVLMRLGAQSLFALGIRRLRKDQSIPPSGQTMWPAIILCNLLFGAGHLPATANLTRLTPLVVARALVLNAVVGIPAGYLYWKEGLEASMIAHGSADVVLHGGGLLVSGKKQGVD